MTRLRHILYASSLTLLWPAGALHAQTVIDYYPLEVGNVWYHQTDTLASAEAVSKTVTVQAVDSIAGAAFYRIEEEMIRSARGDTTTWYSWIRESAGQLLHGAFSYRPSLDPIVIPDGNITVDGFTGDWAGIDTLVADPRNDTPLNYTGDDILAVYASLGTDTLFLRLELYEDVNINFMNGPFPNDGNYQIRVITDEPAYDRFQFGIAYDTLQQTWSLGYNNSGSNIPPEMLGPDLVGVSANQIELAVPLNRIGNPTSFSEISGYVVAANDVVLDKAEAFGASVFDPPHVWISDQAGTPGATWSFQEDILGGEFFYRVASTSETVTVPAGTYNDCIRIDLTITQDTLVVQTSSHYYALGIGEVLIQGTSQWSGDFRYELHDWSFPGVPLAIQVFHDEPVVEQSLNITARFTRPFSTTSQKIFHRYGGEIDYQEREFVQSGNDYVVTIPPQEVWIRGLEYYIQMDGPVASITYPPLNPQTQPIRLQVRVNEWPSMQVTRERSKYRMISVPLVLNHPQIDSVLVDDYGEYDIQQWRLFRYNAWDSLLYDEYPNLQANFTPGTTFWLITRSDANFDVGEGLSMPTQDAYYVVLDTGWNQIGNPFAFPISWNILQKPATIENLVFFDGEDYVYDVQTLTPWEGFFVRNNGPTAVTLGIPPIEEHATPKPHGSSYKTGDGYFIRFSASLAGFNLFDGWNVIGMCEGASGGWDGMDISEAPPIGDFVRLSIAEHGRRFARNLKPASSGQEWPLEISTTIPGARTVRIDLEEIGPRPDGIDLYILDTDLQSPVSLGDGRFEITIDGPGKTRRLLAILGTEEYARGNRDGISLTPLEFQLFQNHPNPFNEGTLIAYRLDRKGPVRMEVFNIIGARIRTLLDGERPAGSHTVEWDGRDEHGMSVGTGVYFVRLQAGEHRSVKKMALMR